MNWFTWIVIIGGAVLAAYVVFELVRPKRSGIDARRREDDMGEAMYRGGHPGRPFDGNVSGP